MYMDFDQALMAAQGHGRYERLDPALLPDGGRLYLMYCDNPSDSGRVHSTVRQRWLAGDVAVKEGMDAVAQCAVDGRWADGSREGARKGLMREHQGQAVWVAWGPACRAREWRLAGWTWQGTGSPGGPCCLVVCDTAKRGGWVLAC